MLPVEGIPFRLHSSFGDREFWKDLFLETLGTCCFVHVALDFATQIMSEIGSNLALIGTDKMIEELCVENIQCWSISVRNYEIINVGRKEDIMTTVVFPRIQL